MCKWGTDTILLVNIPAELSHSGKTYWTFKGIDSCIADLVQSLNDAGILTAACCCGHGKSDGEIVLQDGRVLILPLG